MFDSSKKPNGLKRIYLAAKNSGRACQWLVQNEAAFRQELVMLVVALGLSFYLDIAIGEKIALVLAVLFVMLAEIINTAIEAVVDRIGPEIHPLSGLAKDLGSAAVLLSMVMAIGIWLMVLI